MTRRALVVDATRAGYRDGAATVAALVKRVESAIPDAARASLVLVDNLSRLSRTNGSRAKGVKRATSSARGDSPNGSFPNLPAARIPGVESLIIARQRLDAARAMAHGPARRAAMKRARAALHQAERALG